MRIEYTTHEQIEKMREELHRAGEKKEKAKARPLKIVSLAFFYSFIIFLVFILASILLAKSSGEVPSIFGYQLYRVESGSMSPTLDIGSVILTKEPEDVYALEVGDVVTFKTTSGSIVTHRIIEVITDEMGNIEYRTKGDNPNNSADIDLLDPENVLAIFVFRIPLT